MIIMHITALHFFSLKQSHTAGYGNVQTQIVFSVKMNTILQILLVRCRTIFYYITPLRNTISITVHTS